MKKRQMLMLLALLVASYAAAAANQTVAMTIAPQMYPAWNLGNTMEGVTSRVEGVTPIDDNLGLAQETSWQSTLTTRELIDYVKSLGFKTVRIPCNWRCGHICNAEDHTIDPAWMARVKEIVDYCIGSGLYVVLNDHYDGGWIERSFGDVSDAAIARNTAILTRLWTQIAEEFRDYDHHLLLAGMNEPGLNSAFTPVTVAALQRYQQAFINTVRRTGGLNATRVLIVQGPSTDIDQTYNLYDVTKLTDPAGKGHLMVEIHYYTPWNFCGMEKDEDWGSMFYYWNEENHVSDDAHNASWGEEEFLKVQFCKMKEKFFDKGVPVLMGEYGCQWRDLSSEGEMQQQRHNASVKAFHRAVNLYGPQNGIVPIVWDINYTNCEGTKGVMTIIDRAQKRIFCQPAMDGIREGVACTTWAR